MLYRPRDLQQDSAQGGISLSQETAGAQALQGKEAMLYSIIDEELVLWTQVLVLLQLHLQQVKEIKLQYEEISHLSTLLERQQIIQEKVQEQQSSICQMLHTQPLPTRLEELHIEAFGILCGTVNARHGAGIQYLSKLS